MYEGIYELTKNQTLRIGFSNFFLSVREVIVKDLQQYKEYYICKFVEHVKRYC
jgi:hypothetical protein